MRPQLVACGFHPSLECVIFGLKSIFKNEPVAIVKNLGKSHKMFGIIYKIWKSYNTRDCIFMRQQLARA